MYIIIPSAGNGQRFIDAGYTVPKPLIPIDGIPMIERVVSNLDLPGQYIIITKDDTFQAISDLFKNDTRVHVVTIGNDTTNGSVETVLRGLTLCDGWIDKHRSLLIANCDQLIYWEADDFLRYIHESNVDGIIQTIKTNDPGFSYVKLRGNRVVDVREKEIISEYGTTGLYYWKHVSDYIRYATLMIQQDIRYKNEYYNAPLYNLAIQDNKNIVGYEISKMHPLGTPLQLSLYEDR